MDNKMKKLSNEEMIMVGQKCTCESCGSPHGVYCINPYLEDVEQEQVLACLCEDCYDRYIDDIQRYARVIQGSESRPDTSEVGGSNPSSSTTSKKLSFFL